MGACCCDSTIASKNNLTESLTPNQNINHTNSNGNSKQTISKDVDCYQYFPELSLLSITNGVIALKITNISDLEKTFGTNPFSSWQFYRFILLFQFNFKPKSEPKTANVWNFIICKADNIERKRSIFYLRVPLKIYDYDLHIKLACEHTIINQESNPNDRKPQRTLYQNGNAEPLVIHVSSALMSSEFEIGQKITFRQPNAMFITSGVVIKGLIIDKNEEKEEKINENESGHDDGFLYIMNEETKEEMKIAKSRVYQPPIYNCFVLELTNRVSVHQNLLLRILPSKRAECQLMIKHLQFAIGTYFTEWYFHKTIVESHSILCKMEFGGYDQKYINQFFAVHIVQYLYETEYHSPKIACLVGSSDGYLNIERYVKSSFCSYLRSFKCAEVLTTKELQQCWAYCDICYISISVYGWIGRCASVGDDHVFCMSCINNRLEMHVQLQEFLGYFLRNKLNADCIQQLVGFVVGHAIVDARQKILFSNYLQEINENDVNNE